MLTKNTVFVIGAGSGFDIKMPLGSDLLRMIEKQAQFRILKNEILEDPEALVRAMFWDSVQGDPSRTIPRDDVNNIFEANMQISKAANLIGSIDDYVNLHNNNSILVWAAKIQIAYSILLSEGRSLLALDNEWNEASDLKKVTKSWMLDFFKIISKPSLSTNPSDLFANISIINFNYDRCLEQFLVSAIPNLYNISIENAASIVRSANIIHPYGQVGDLPILIQSSDSVKFGDTSNRKSITSAAKLIRTYTEQVKSNIVTQIKNLINASDQVIFLGFGYHKQNIDLISSPRSGYNNRALIGTAIGESQENILEYGDRLLGVGGSQVPGRRMPDNMFLHPHFDCSTLLQNYREVISH